MVKAITSAKKAGHLRADVDPEQLLFEIDALSGTRASATSSTATQASTTAPRRPSEPASEQQPPRRDSSPVALLAQHQLGGQGDTRRRRRVGSDRHGLGDAARQRQPLAARRLDDDVVARLDQRALQPRAPCPAALR